MNAHLDEATSRYGSDALITTLLDENVPASKINSIPNVVGDPHIKEHEMLQEYEREDGEDVVVPSVPMKLSQSDPLDADEIPDAGEHSRAVLREIGYSAEEIEALVAKGTVRP